MKILGVSASCGAVASGTGATVVKTYECCIRPTPKKFRSSYHEVLSATMEKTDQRGNDSNNHARKADQALNNNISPAPSRPFNIIRGAWNAVCTFFTGFRRSPVTVEAPAADISTTAQPNIKT